MKNIIKLLLFLLIKNLSLSDDLPFNYERLNTNFNGIVANNNRIIAYGQCGIILSSTDRGINWSQKAIAGNVFDILKIIEIENSFYGILSKNYLVISKDGDEWTSINLSPDSTLFDITSDGNSLYILTGQSILNYSFDGERLISMPIDTINHSKEILYNDFYLYLTADSGKITRYSIKDNFAKTIIDFKLMNLCTNCEQPVDLKINNRTLFVSLNRKLLFTNKDSLSNWKVKSEFVSLYSIHNNNIYDFSTNYNILNNTSYISFFRLNQEGIPLRLDKDTVTRYVPFIIITDYRFFGNDTIIAVGRYKQIIISTDGGRSWNIMSSIYIDQNEGYVNWINDKMGFVSGGKLEICKTTDGGTTWLPQYYDPILYQTKFRFFHFSFFPNGTGIGIADPSNNDSTNMLITKDFGGTYQKKTINEFAYYRFEGGKTSVKFDDEYIFVLNRRWGANYFTTVFVLDSLFNYKSYTQFDSLTFRNIFQTGNINELICIGYERKYYNGNTYDSTSFYFMKSTDRGASWTKVFRVSLNNLPNWIYNGSNYLLVSDVLNDNGIWWHYIKYIDLINQKQMTLMSDSITDFNQYFTLNDDMYCGGWGYMFVNQKLNDSPYNWGRYIMDKYYLRSAWSDNKVAYISGSTIGENYPIILKITPKKINSVETQPEIKTYFYAFPPYPNPAKTDVRCNIFWDTRYDINEAVIGAYDIYGCKVSEKSQFDLNVSEVWHGILKWDCSTVPEGVYFIRILHGDVTKTIPVLVGGK
ncbi:MAG: hypothetical protein HW421_1448 [Ignavibacteria bacterium]|nr:hypothetical protein [Ignavibacteria bacterium]